MSIFFSISHFLQHENPEHFLSAEELRQLVIEYCDAQRVAFSFCSSFHLFTHHHLSEVLQEGKENNKDQSWKQFAARLQAEDIDWVSGDARRALRALSFSPQFNRRIVLHSSRKRPYEYQSQHYNKGMFCFRLFTDPLFSLHFLCFCLVISIVVVFCLFFCFSRITPD